MLSKQEEEQERIDTIRNDADVRRQQQEREQGTKVASQRSVFDGIVCTWSSEITFPLMRGLLIEIRYEHP